MVPQFPQITLHLISRKSVEPQISQTVGGDSTLRCGFSVFPSSVIASHLPQA
jgi:hypothetical protein